MLEPQLDCMCREFICNAMQCWAKPCRDKSRWLRCQHNINLKDNIFVFGDSRTISRIHLQNVIRFSPVFASQRRQFNSSWELFLFFFEKIFYRILGIMVRFKDIFQYWRRKIYLDKSVYNQLVMLFILNWRNLLWMVSLAFLSMFLLMLLMAPFTIFLVSSSSMWSCSTLACFRKTFCHLIFCKNRWYRTCHWKD